MDDLVLAPGLYIVATPIGNLGDLSPRAAQILMKADVVAVEDSRVTAGLFRHLGTKGRMLPYHDHNADAVRPGLIARMASEAVALVSDAGTPLISDPGFKLVRDARAAGHVVTTIPGPCAAIARAVIGRPDFLLADEPTGNVDPDLSLRLVRLFAELNKLGTTIILATHELPLLDNFTFPRMLLEDGRVVIDG